MRNYSFYTLMMFWEFIIVGHYEYMFAFDTFFFFSITYDVFVLLAMVGKDLDIKSTFFFSKVLLKSDWLLK